MSSNNVNKASKEILVFVSMLLLLLLIAQNINSYFYTEKVLGAKTTSNSSEIFWIKFLEENPNYIPGLIEIGKLDKAFEVDPNYNINP